MKLLLWLAWLLSLVAGAFFGPVVAGAATTCTDPAWVTSKPDGMWSNGGYIVQNNMWNASGYRVQQTLAACSYRTWHVTATADNSGGDGAVKTYPNVHKDFHHWDTGWEPKISSFTSIKSSFAASSPHVGIYDVAYDIWLNGVADRNSYEVMLWTENHKQVPWGTVRGTTTFLNRTWKVYVNGHYIAFVPNKPVLSGTVGLKRRFHWLTNHGILPAGATLGAVDYGVEVVSTGGNPARFDFSNFSVTTTK